MEKKLARCKIIQSFFEEKWSHSKQTRRFFTMDQVKEYLPQKSAMFALQNFWIIECVDSVDFLATAEKQGRHLAIRANDT